jgi:hypothetical protein
VDDERPDVPTDVEGHELGVRARRVVVVVARHGAAE